MTPKTKGYTFALTAIVIFSLQDGISKHLGTSYPPVFIAMMRYWAFGLFVCLLAAKSPGGIAVVARSKLLGWQIFRGVLLAAQIVMSITSFTTVGLAHSQAIFAGTPLIVALLSMPLLGEKVGWRRWLAIVIGLCGVLIILRPSEASTFNPNLVIPITASVMFAIYAIATRLVSRVDPATTSFFYTGVAGAAAISLIGPFYWTNLAAPDWGWMLLLCITGISGHYMLIRAYDLLDAVAVQPITYLQLVLACIMGVLLFHETLTVNMVTGSVIVVGAGIFTVWRENMVARRQAKAARTVQLG
jgi:drug/metabolite transporter (DMT)-like permease